MGRHPNSNASNRSSKEGVIPVRVKWLVSAGGPGPGLSFQMVEYGSDVWWARRGQNWGVAQECRGARMETVSSGGHWIWGLTGGEAERNKGTDRAHRPIALPYPGVAAHRVVAAFVAALSERFENPDQHQSFAAGLGLVRRQRAISDGGPQPVNWSSLGVSTIRSSWRG